MPRAQIVTADGGPAAAGLNHAREHFQSGGFASAIRAEKADDLPGRNLEGKRIHGRLFAETLGKLVEDNHL